MPKKSYKSFVVISSFISKFLIFRSQRKAKQSRTLFTVMIIIIIIIYFKTCCLKKIIFLCVLHTRDRKNKNIYFASSWTHGLNMDHRYRMAFRCSDHGGAAQPCFSCTQPAYSLRPSWILQRQRIEKPRRCCNTLARWVRWSVSIFPRGPSPLSCLHSLSIKVGKVHENRREK